MKKTAKIILSSALTMGLCASIIAGSTFALFTSESDVNIAITSGKVDVTASAEIARAWSAEPSGEGYTEKDIVADGDGMYTFTNKGTASYADSKLTLNNISPGDGVEFTVKVDNKSTISIRYQMRIALNDTTLGANGEKLSDKLTAEIKETSSAGKYGAITGRWSDPIDPEVQIEPFTVKVYLPIETGDAYQDLASELTLSVYAVQGNASDKTPLADVIVNSEEGLQDALTDFAKSDEKDMVLGLMDDMSISDEAPITVPENKDLTLDVNGKTVDVNKTTVEGESLVVPTGSTLTITDSDKSEEGGGGFNLTVKADAKNWSSGPNGKYTMRVEEDSTLNLEDVQVTIFDKIDGQDAQPNHAVYVGGGTLNCNAGTKIDYVGKNFSDGFLIREGGTMNVTGTTIHSTGAVGQITVGYLSYAEKESTVNINDGTVIEYSGANSMAGAVIVYQTGNVNIHEGAMIRVCGEIPQEYDSQKEQYQNSAAAAIRVVGGGNVTMDGGTISLETTTQNGWAYAVMVLGNAYADPKVAEGKAVAGQEVNAHIEFKGNTTILANDHAILFAAQKNYRLQFNTDENGIPNSNLGNTGGFTMVDGKLVPTIIIRQGVTIMSQDKVVTKADSVFAQNSGSQYENTLGAYSPNAIDDQRTFD